MAWRNIKLLTRGRETVLPQADKGGKAPPVNQMQNSNPNSRTLCCSVLLLKDAVAVRVQEPVATPTATGELVTKLPPLVRGTPEHGGPRDLPGNSGSSWTRGNAAMTRETGNPGC